MSAKWKVILLVMLIIVASNSVLLGLFIKDNRASLEALNNKELAGIRGLIATLSEENHSKYRTRIVSLIDYENLPEREKVLAAFASRNRDELLRLTRPFLDRLRGEDPHFSSFAWLTPDNHVFLRVFMPTVYGDDISHMRPDIVDTNKNLVQNSGFKTAHTGLEYRVVQPVYYRGKHIGAVQFGLKDSMLPDAIHENLEIPVALVIGNRVFTTIKKSNLPSVFGKTHTFLSRHVDFFKGFADSVDWSLERQVVHSGGQTYLLARAFEMLDFKKERQGCIFVALDITSQTRNLQARIIFIVLLTAGMMLASFVLLYRSYGSLVEKIVSLNRTLEESNLQLEERVDRRTTQLRESEERFKTVLDSLPVDVYVTAVDTYEILFMNQHMIQEYGGDLTGRVCWQSFRSDQKPCPHCSQSFLVNGQEYPNGTYVWDEKNCITGKHYINYGRVIEWVGQRTARLHVASDITEMKSLEGQLRQKYKMEAVGVMAGGIAHNFNNSLAIIIGSLEMALRKKGNPDKFEAYIDNARMAAKRSRDLVTQILTYSRRGDNQIEPILLEPVVDETQTLMRSTLPTTVNLIYDVPSYAGALNINADASQIQEILLNLCNNAVQAMKEKGNLVIQLGSVQLNQSDIPTASAGKPGPYARISVQDSGCGIEPEILDKIFDPFFTTKANGEGTGMGLATVQAIVERHDGIMTVETEVGKGTTFHLYFPLLLSTTAQAAKEAAPSVPSGDERILVVDDEKVVTDLESHMLGELGYRVVSTVSSSEALRMIAVDPDAFDLLITDQTMPEMTGIELVAEVKKIKPDLRSILCTGYSSEASSERAKEEGINAFVMKPLDFEELGLVVRRVLDT